MNDEFLYQLRKPPPEDFARRLKARLDRQGPVGTPRKRSVNLYALIAVLVGGTAFAFVSPTVRNAALAWFNELRAEQLPEQPARQVVVAKAAERPAAVAPSNNRQFQSSWKWGGDAANTPAAPAAPTRARIALVSSWPAPAFTSFIDRSSQIGPFELPSIFHAAPGAGYATFCKGVGIDHHDLLLTHGFMTPRQLQYCTEKGAVPLTEFKVGYEAMVLAAHANGTSWLLSPRDVYFALSLRIPDPENPRRVIKNPNTTWRQVNPSLPDVKIAVIGPARYSNVYNAFIRIVVSPACFAAVSDVREATAKPNSDTSLCGSLRTDGAYIEGGADDDAVLRYFANNPAALGVFSYNHLPYITGRYTPLTIDGVSPSYATLSGGHYPLSQPLVVYIKRAQFQFVPDLARFTKAYAALGFTPQGIVPLSEGERARSRAEAQSVVNFQPSKVTGR